MKSFYLCIISLFFLYSCSETSELEAFEKPYQDDLFYANKLVDSISQLLPFNPANKFDYVGELHYELYQDYYAQLNDSLSLFQVSLTVEQLANQQPKFINHFGNTYNFSHLNTITSLLDCNTSCVATVLSNSSLSLAAQEKMKIFFTDFELLFEKSITSDEVLKYVMLFEDEIIHSSSFTAFDKSVILSTTSIARFSTYESKRRPKKNSDPEWDSLITNLLGTIVGCEYSIADGLIASLICGIQSN